MIRLTASQTAASAAWGQTWEIRIPVCSAIDSGEVNLACEEMWDVLRGGKQCQVEFMARLSRLRRKLTNQECNACGVALFAGGREAGRGKGEGGREQENLARRANHL